MLSDCCLNICPWADIAVALRCLRMGKIDVITYKCDNNKMNLLSLFRNFTFSNIVFILQ